MKQKPERVKQVNYKKLEKNQCTVLMPFGSSKILNRQSYHKFHNQAITEVALVYTEYAEAESFSQPELNRARLQALFNFAPEIFSNTAIRWRFLAQTRAKNDSLAHKMFHGFIITWQVPVTTSTGGEVALIKKEFTKMKAKDSFAWIPRTRKLRHVYYLPVSQRKRDAGITYAEKGIWNRKRVVQVEEVHDSVWAKVWPESGTYAIDFGAVTITDSTIFKVLDRNRNWTNMIVVEDVTASMAGYTSSMLIWNRLTEKTRRTSNFVFFNDGDNKPDDQKQVGKTGGIYFINSPSPEKIEKTAIKAMTNGFGGDAPENNLEAVIHAINDCPTCENIVMIADNFANVKDIELLKEIKKPVKIILCGAQAGVNTEYLDIARATKGSVHTLESDLTELMNLNEGQRITIGNYTYEIKDGKFVLAY